MKALQPNTGTNHLSPRTLYSLGAFTGATLGTSLGGLCGFLFPEPYYQLTNPAVLKDGQWGMIYFLSIPVGLVVGLLIGIVAGLMVANKIK